MAKLKKALKILVVNLVLLALLMEAGSVAIYFVRTRGIFYRDSTDRRLAGFTVPPSPINKGGEQQATMQQLHPYFGFVDRRGLNHRFPFSQVDHVSNNFGFASGSAYPFKRQHPNQFLVGIFGGSVAANYSFFELERNILAAELKKLPALANKEIIILPFAMGAFKQPQQLIVLSYFLSIGQDFDLVVNIDGFNDVVLSYINYRDGLDSSMPCGYIIVPLVNLAACHNSEEELQLTAEVIQKRKKLEGLLKSMETSRLATGYVISWIRTRFAERNYRQAVVELDRLRTSKSSGQSYMQFPSRPDPGVDQAFKEMVANWGSSSLMMKQLLDQRSVPYFQFLQPNQYFPTHRVFGSNEKEIALTAADNFRPGVLKGYPLLLDELAPLQQQGVNVQSAVSVFDGINEAVYGDNCCHYNELGNRILSEFVAHAIRESLSKDKRYASTAAGTE